MTTNIKAQILISDFLKLSDLEIKQKYLNCLQWTESIKLNDNNLNNIALRAFSNDQYEPSGFIFDKSEIKNNNICDRIKELLRQKIVNNDYQACNTSSLAMKYLASLEDNWAIAELKKDYDREDYFYLDKWQIIDAFSLVADLSIISYFIYGLFECDHSCRCAAVRVLENRVDIKKYLKIDILIHALCQKLENEEERYILNMIIGEALNKISPVESIEKLSLMLKCDEPNIRINSLQALRYIKHQSIVDISITALNDNLDTVVTEALKNLFAYPQLNNLETNIILSVNSLDNCLKSNNSKIFELTLELIKPSIYTTDLNLILQVKELQPIHNFLLERVQEDDEQIRVEAIYKLGCCDFVEVKYKLRQLTEDVNPKIQAYAAYALGKISDISDISLLITKLKHPQAIVREGAVNGLRLMGNESAKQPLIETLEDLSEKNIHVKNSIIQALGVIGGEDIEEYLIQLAQNSNYITLLDEIISILGILGGEKTVQLLKYFLDKTLNATKQEDYIALPDTETVILALERIGNNSAIEVLLDIAQYNSYPYSQACLSLARVGKLETIPSLWEIQLNSEYMGLLDAISYIQECYQHYNPNYCQINTKNIKNNLIGKHNDNYKNYLRLAYYRLSDYRI